MENADVVIVGSSVAGLMTAAYLKQQLPTMHVVVLGPSPEDGGPTAVRQAAPRAHLGKPRMGA